MRRLLLIALICLLFPVISVGQQRLARALSDVFDKEFVNERSGVRPYTSYSLRSIKNPKGQGDIVFLTWSTNHVWVVIEDRPFCLNGRAKGATPNLSFLREAPQYLQDRAKLTVADIPSILELTKKYER